MIFILFPASLEEIRRGWPEGEGGEASSTLGSACPAHGVLSLDRGLAFSYLSFPELDLNSGLTPGPGTLFLSSVSLAEKSQSKSLNRPEFECLSQL